MMTTNDGSEVPLTAAEVGIMVGSPPDRLIDPHGWDKGPDARWAFQHISEIVPTARVSRGRGAPTVFATDLREIAEITFDDAGVVRTVGEALTSTFTDAFVVLVDGTIVHEDYRNGMGPDTLHLLMSVSKSVTGTLMGVLVDDGRIDPDAPVTDYLPELGRSPGYADATVRHVLDMTTAVRFSEDYDDPDAEVAAHEQAMAWRGRTELAEAGLYAFAQTIQRVERPHGELFHYASINTDVLGWLIERASGQRFSDVMSESIWSRLGAEHDADLSVDFRGSAVANGGFCMTARDLARFAQMVLDRGVHNGEQIIPADWIDDFRQQGQNSAWLPTVYGSMYPAGRYRSQWYSTGDDHGAFFAIGVNGQHIWIDPATRTVVVKLSSMPKSVDYPLFIRALGAIAAVARSSAQVGAG